MTTLFVGPQLRIPLQLPPILVGTARGVVFERDVRDAHPGAGHVEVFVYLAQSVTQVRTEQSMHWFASEAACPHRMTKEVRTSPQQPNVGALDVGREQCAQALLRGDFQPFVRIEQQDPRLRGKCDCRILLPCETLPIEMLHPRAEVARD